MSIVYNYLALLYGQAKDIMYIKVGNIRVYYTN